MDTVSNEELLEILEDVAAGYDCTRVLSDTPEIAATMAREILALRAQQRWISVTERLPTAGQLIVIQPADPYFGFVAARWDSATLHAVSYDCDECGREFCYRPASNGQFTLAFALAGATQRIFTRWIPLPDPPDEEGEVS